MESAQNFSLIPFDCVAYCSLSLRLSGTVISRDSMSLAITAIKLLVCLCTWFNGIVSLDSILDVGHG